MFSSVYTYDQAEKLYILVAYYAQCVQHN